MSPPGRHGPERATSVAQGEYRSTQHEGTPVTHLLAIEQLHGGYGRVEVLRGVDLHVNAGEVVALLGSNGAGKSTLNNTVCGLIPAWSGRVCFDGTDLTRAHYKDVVRAGLIQVPEGRRVFPNLTVLEYL